MILILSINASTTDDAIEDAIPYVDMRVQAIDTRDVARAFGPTDTILVEYYEVDGVNVLFWPTEGGALVNEHTSGTGDSLWLDNRDARSVDQAVRAWRGEDNVY